MQRAQRQAAGIRAFERVINGAIPFKPSELMKLDLPLRVSLEQIRLGKGVEKDIRDLLAIAKVCALLSKKQPPALRVAEAAGVALRGALASRAALDEPGFADVEACLTLHELYIRNFTPRKLVDAMAVVLKNTLRETA